MCAFLAVWSLAGLPSPVRAQSSTPDAPAQLSVDDVDGNAVTLTWTPPVDDQPDAYILEGGYGPDDVVGSIAIGNDATSVTLPLPSGIYFIRTYAVVDGVRSAPSNEVRVMVGQVSPPSGPDNFMAVAIGNSLALSWRTTFDAGTPDQAVLEVAGPVAGTFALPNTESFRVSGVPDGIYTLRLRTSNSAGESPSTPAITVSMPGLVPVVLKNPAGAPGDPRLPVRYEHQDALRLTELATREGLAAVIAGATSEFDAMLRLKDWTSAQFAPGDPNPYPPWDALIVLDAIRAGITGGFCGQYSQVLLQSLTSFGLTARYVEVGPTDNPYAHYVVEAWSNQFAKWVVLDGDFNVHFERNGVPLSAMEVHDAVASGTTSAVTIVHGTLYPGHLDESTLPGGMLSWYYYLRYHLKSDHLSVQNEVSFDRYNDMMEFMDPRTVPWDVSPVDSIYPKEVLTAQRTTDRAMAEAPINEVWLTTRVSGAAEVSVDIAGFSMPSIAALEYRVLDAQGLAGPWQRIVALSIPWQVAPSDRVMEVRGVNMRGVAGAISSVALVTP